MQLPSNPDNATRYAFTTVGAVFGAVFGAPAGYDTAAIGAVTYGAAFLLAHALGSPGWVPFCTRVKNTTERSVRWARSLRAEQ
jgi:hypothetical protein